MKQDVAQWLKFEVLSPVFESHSSPHIASSLPVLSGGFRLPIPEMGDVCLMRVKESIKQILLTHTLIRALIMREVQQISNRVETNDYCCHSSGTLKCVCSRKYDPKTQNSWRGGTPSSTCIIKSKFGALNT